MEIRRKRECNPTTVYDQNSRGACVLLGTPAEGATYVLHKLHSNACLDKKVGMEDAVRNNNALHGHMIPVPVFGLCHCSPERRFLSRCR